MVSTFKVFGSTLVGSWMVVCQGWVVFGAKSPLLGCALTQSAATTLPLASWTVMTTVALVSVCLEVLATSPLMFGLLPLIVGVTLLAASGITLRGAEKVQ